jgi:hypothetical protein
LLKRSHTWWRELVCVIELQQLLPQIDWLTGGQRGPEPHFKELYEKNV